MEFSAGGLPHQQADGHRATLDAEGGRAREYANMEERQPSVAPILFPSWYGMTARNQLTVTRRSCVKYPTVRSPPYIPSHRASGQHIPGSVPRTGERAYWQRLFWPASLGLVCSSTNDIHPGWEGWASTGIYQIPLGYSGREKTHTRPATVSWWHPAATSPCWHWYRAAAHRAGHIVVIGEFRALFRTTLQTLSLKSLACGLWRGDTAGPESPSIWRAVPWQQQDRGAARVSCSVSMRRMFGKDEEQSSSPLPKFIRIITPPACRPIPFPLSTATWRSIMRDICRRKDVDSHHWPVLLPASYAASSFLVNGMPRIRDRRSADFREQAAGRVPSWRRSNRNKFLSDLVMAPDLRRFMTRSFPTGPGEMIILTSMPRWRKMKSRGEDISIHSAVAFCYQKIRKENGAVMTIIQSPDQLPDDEFTKVRSPIPAAFSYIPSHNGCGIQGRGKRFEMGATPQCNMVRSHPQRLFRERPYPSVTSGHRRVEVSRWWCATNWLEKFPAFQTDGRHGLRRGYSGTMPRKR